MRTGCQPPYCHGTGGFCGCNCKCCPPPCCPVISVFFQCCSPTGFGARQGDNTPVTTWDNLPLEVPTPNDLPSFSAKPIFSPDRRFTLGLGSVPTSCPCETVCIELQCGGELPCCCLELLGGTIYSVGNGFVTAPTTVIVPNCGEANVLINGLPSPVFVNDCEVITVTLEVIVTDPPCCATQCLQVDVACAPCVAPLMIKAPLWKRRIDPRTGKTKINPKTGRPIILIDKT